ncbi:hypothetical protein JavanS175_0003 [Streptococcus satellite phage Javan175]|uniref:hypothetical protein n=1 Tax=Streptococcus entericus TaxID=155680 RepID=UPI0003828764|nr:hypothetical protein [Streptococcus entericus]QBX07744.1 hypothetical protein JavanS175_0003 [Streptococcus satellite phage Javan175]
MAELRRCSKCKNTKELTPANYSKKRTGRKGFEAACKECKKKRDNEHYTKNRDQILAQKRRYYQQRKKKLKNQDLRQQDSEEDIKERLKHLRAIPWLIEELEQERERTKATLVLLPSLWEKKKTMYQGDIDKLRTEQQATLDLIDRLNYQIDRDMMLARYRDGLKWEEVAQNLQYSVSNLKRRHKQVLEQLEELDDQETANNRQTR